MRKYSKKQIGQRLAAHPGIDVTIIVQILLRNYFDLALALISHLHHSIMRVSWNTGPFKVLPLPLLSGHCHSQSDRLLPECGSPLPRAFACIDCTIWSGNSSSAYLGRFSASMWPETFSVSSIIIYHLLWSRAAPVWKRLLTMNAGRSTFGCFFFPSESRDCPAISPMATYMLGTPQLIINSSYSSCGHQLLTVRVLYTQHLALSV